MAAQGTDHIVIERGGVLYKLTLAEAIALASGGGAGGNIDGGDAASVPAPASAIDGGSAA